MWRKAATIEFYTGTFPDSAIRHVSRAGKNGPVQSAEFVLGGQTFKVFNGGPGFAFSDGISLFVECENQEAVDTYWDRFVSAGGTPVQCGWIRDHFGLSWQIIPRRFIELMNDEDPKMVKAVVEVMMKMVKLDVATSSFAGNSTRLRGSPSAVGSEWG